MERPGKRGLKAEAMGSTGRAGGWSAERGLSHSLALCSTLVSSSRNGEEMKHLVHPPHGAWHWVLLPTGPPDRDRETTVGKLAR